MTPPFAPRVRSRRSLWLFRVVALGGSLLLTLMLLEIGFRLFHPLDLHLTDTFLARDWQYGKEGMMSLAPGARTRIRRKEFDTAVRVNSLGLREREIGYPKPAGVRRVLCLGDSQTFGFGVEAEEAYARVLEGRLGAGAQALNAGVPGMGTAHELYFLETEGWQYAPDAVTVGFFFNDIRDSGQCRLYALDKDRLVRAARPSADPIALRQALGAPASKEDVTLVRAPERSLPRPSFWVRHSHLARFVRERAAAAYRRTAPAESLLRIVEARALTSRLMGEIAGQCEARRVPLIVILIPSREECADPSVLRLEAKYAEVLERVRTRARVLDLLPSIRKAGWRRCFFIGDEHLNAYGHRLAAGALAHELKALMRGRSSPNTRAVSSVD